MKYLIVGADGQLGQEWVRYLSNERKDFSAYTFSDLDITDFEETENIIRNENPDVLINCAAYTAVDKAEEEKELAHLINHRAVEKLARLSKMLEFKLIHYSTDYVFAGDEEDQKKYPNGYPENANTNPINEYGLSKLKGEQSIISSGCEYLIIRLSWLCGSFGNNFVKTMLRLAKGRTHLKVVNDQLGVPTFASQVVLESSQLINSDRIGTYHLGSEGIISWYDLAQKIFFLSDIDIEVNPVSSSEYQTKARRPLFSKLSIEKIKNELNISPLHWEKGLKDLIKDLNR